MRARLAVSAFLVAAASAAAQETVDLRVKLAANAQWKVEQTIEMTTNFKAKPGTPAGAGEQPLAKAGAKFRETWVDKCLKDVEGRPVSLRRTWEVSDIQAGGRALVATTMKGAVVKLDEKDKEANCLITSEKDKGNPQTLNALSKGTAELLVLLLPKDPVKVGEEWPVQAFYVHQFLRVATSSAPCASRESLGDLAKVIENLKATSGGPFGADVKGKVESVEKDVAKITFAGRLDEGNTSTEISGTLTWTVSKRMPASLTWTQKKTVRADADRGTSGWVEDWKIVRTWK